MRSRRGFACNGRPPGTVSPLVYDDAPQVGRLILRYRTIVDPLHHPAFTLERTTPKPVPAAPAPRFRPIPQSRRHHPEAPEAR
jgi:hypothetical protein